jgi:hypothetical protein
MNSSPEDDSSASSTNPTNAKPGLADGLLSANRELRASIVSNVITKGLVGLGVGVGLALFVFKRISAPLSMICRQSRTGNVHHRLWTGNVIFRGFPDGP